MTLEAYNETEDEQDSSDNSESVTYVEISSIDYPEAYSNLAQGGPIRGFFKGKSASVKDLYADLTNALAPYFEGGDKQPLLEWILVSDNGSVDEDALEDFLENHDVDLSDE